MRGLTAVRLPSVFPLMIGLRQWFAAIFLTEMTPPTQSGGVPAEAGQDPVLLAVALGMLIAVPLIAVGLGIFITVLKIRWVRRREEDDREDH